MPGRTADVLFPASSTSTVRSDAGVTVDGAGPVPDDPQHEAEPLGPEAAYGAEATHAPQDEEQRPLVAAENGQRRAADSLAPERSRSLTGRVGLDGADPRELRPCAQLRHRSVSPCIAISDRAPPTRDSPARCSP